MTTDTARPAAPPADGRNVTTRTARPGRAVPPWGGWHQLSGLPSSAGVPRRGWAPAAPATRLAVAALVMAVGVATVSAADAAGRAGASSAGFLAAYWLGEVLVFAPAVWRVASRAALTGTEGTSLVVGLGLATYLVKYLYSPAYFGFPDELLHWRTTTDLLATHHLFGVNYALPISPAYPGLEEATGALVSVTGLPLFAAGLIIAGLAHLLLAAALYLVFREASGSTRTAVAACVIYATNPHYQVIDAIFGYQTLALAFLALTLAAALHLGSQRHPRGRARWLVVGCVLAAATVVTHHVTSYALTAALALITVAGVVRRSWGTRRRVPGTESRVGWLAVLAGTCAALVGAWVRWAAPATVSYLAPAARDFAAGFAGIAGAHTAARGATPAGSLPDLLASYAAVALVALGLPIGWRRIWRTHHRCRTWAIAFGIGSACYYVVVALRLTTPGGGQLSGRALTFLYVPVSYTLAVALAWIARAVPRRHPNLSHVLPALTATSLMVLLVGGLAAGWPPSWERLPGHYVVEGFESGVTPEGMAAATWTRDALGPGQRIAADFTNSGLLGSYGGQSVVTGVDRLYCGGARWTAADAALASAHEVRYLMVDLRMSHDRPQTGYFGDTAACPKPIPPPNLAKFTTVAGVSRVYDSGQIIVYAFPGGRYAP